MVKLHHPGHVATLAMMVAGIVLSKKAQLPKMAGEIPGQAKDKSLKLRMRRWVEHPQLEAELIYLPFAIQILQALAHNPLTLVMDASAVGRSCQVLMIGVVYKQRALPLVWLVYRGKIGHTHADCHIAVLEKLQPLIPAGAKVVLLGDAQYDNTDMLLWLEAQPAWQYVLRTAPQIYIHSELGALPIADIQLQKEQVLQYSKLDSPRPPR